MATTRGQSKRKDDQIHLSIISKVPTDLMYNILSRLPVKSLLMFKSVSKEGYSIIKNPSFIRQHQEYSHLNPNPNFGAILSTVSVKETGKKKFRVNLFEALDKPVDIELPFMTSCSQCEILGICNSLVCVMVENESSNIMICNPLTGDFLKVPDMDKNKRDWYFELGNDKEIHFGFCLNGDKGYELFRMGFSCGCGEEPSLEWEVFSLNTNTWREIHVKGGGGGGGGGVYDDLGDDPEPCYHRGLLPVFLRGVFYWEITNFCDEFVLSFDVEKEVFDVLMCPGGCQGDDWDLGVVKEELVAVAYPDDYYFLSIYVLNVQEKFWIRKFIVDNYGIQLKMLGCTRRGQLVMENRTDETRELFLYDIDTKEEELLPYVNHGADDNVFLYTESLGFVNSSDDVVKSALKHPMKNRKDLPKTKKTKIG